MRIIAGTAKGRILKTADGLNTRPTADRVKEAIFSSLYQKTIGANILDVFAGSGAFALEALSRNATYATLIEQDRAAICAINANIANCGFEQKTQLLKGDALKILAKLNQQYQLIFLDPPYNQGLLNPILALISKHKLLAKDGLIIIETTTKGSEFNCPTNFQIDKKACYGQTTIYYIMEGA